MKHISDYVFETQCSAAVKNIRSEVEKRWPDGNVQVVQKKFKFYMNYDVYVYNAKDIDELKELDGILKRNIPAYRGKNKDQLEVKFKEIKDAASKKTPFSIPAIFIRFASTDFK